MKKQESHNKYDIFLADWLAGKITDLELEKIVSREDFSVYKKIKKSLEQVEPPAFDATKRYSDLKTKLEHTHKTKKIVPNWMYAVAASLMLFIGVYQFLQINISNKTNYGQTQEIALNEGTIIHLNAQSTLNYSKFRSQRDVNLKGEAFFEVTKKGNFSVKTSHGLVEVLGTKFNVISRDDFFEVVCYEGKVKVTYKENTKILTQKNAWRIIPEQSETWNASDKTAGWLKGETSFRSVPIRYVFKALENQYGIELITVSIDNSVRYTGSFSHNNIESALQSICLPLGFSFEIKNNQTVLLTK